MRSPSFLTFLLFVLTLCCVPSVLLAEFQYGDPTAAEQAHLEAINRARLDPSAEAARLGIDLLEGVPAGEITGDPVQPLTSNSKLLEAARLHSADMVARNFFAHDNPDRLSFTDRIDAAGYNWITAGENIAIQFSTAPLDEVTSSLRMHDFLFVDEGFPGRGHRINILRPAFREVGVGLAFGDFTTGGKTYDNAWDVTCDFGADPDQRSFLLGVVYEDANKDGQYTAGEGLGGIEVEVEPTGTATATASAGGFGIPLFAGTYDVIFRHPDLGEVTKSVTINAENVKLDVLASELVRDGSTTPQLALILNKSEINPAERLTINVTTDSNEDLYVVVLLEDSGIFASFTDFNKIGPVNQAVPFQGTGTAVLDIIWPTGGNFPGTYVFGAILVRKGATPLDSANWIKVAVATLTAR